MKESEEFKEKERDRKRPYYNTNLDDCKAKSNKYYKKESIAEKHRTAMRCRMREYFADEENAKKHGKKMQEHYADKENARKHRKKMQEYYADQENARKHRAAMRWRMR